MTHCAAGHGLRGDRGKRSLESFVHHRNMSLALVFHLPSPSFLLKPLCCRRTEAQDRSCQDGSRSKTWPAISLHCRSGCSESILNPHYAKGIICSVILGYVFNGREHPVFLLLGFVFHCRKMEMQHMWLVKKYKFSIEKLVS